MDTRFSKSFISNIVTKLQSEKYLCNYNLINRCSIPEVLELIDNISSLYLYLSSEYMSSKIKEVFNAYSINTAPINVVDYNQWYDMCESDYLVLISLKAGLEKVSYFGMHFVYQIDRFSSIRSGL